MKIEFFYLDFFFVGSSICVQKNLKKLFTQKKVFINNKILEHYAPAVIKIFEILKIQIYMYPYKVSFRLCEFPSCEYIFMYF